MRLIDADALMQTLGITDMDCEKCAWHKCRDGWARCTRGGDFEDACVAIEHAPTIEERKSGKWTPHRERSREYIGTVLVNVTYDYWFCDTCGYRVENGRPMYNFCPNCGAYMRGENDDKR